MQSWDCAKGTVKHGNLLKIFKVKTRRTVGPCRCMPTYVQECRSKHPCLAVQLGVCSATAGFQLGAIMAATPWPSGPIWLNSREPQWETKARDRVSQLQAIFGAKTNLFRLPTQAWLGGTRPFLRTLLPSKQGPKKDAAGAKNGPESRHFWKGANPYSPRTI